ncbi:unnamed protein product [Fusarium fujikuroi]|nr:unnamed protein product [Fusarium fujikuroi]
MNGHHGYAEGDQEREYREMVEIDVQRQHQQQHEQRQYQQQEYFQQDLHSPYGPPEQQFTPYSPYQSSTEEFQGRSVTEQGRPARPSPAHFDDYSPAPEWPPQIANSPGQYFNDTPGGSRSASPTLRSGRETPARLHHHPGNSSVDWRPSSLMVSSRTLVNKSSNVTDSVKQNQSHLSLAALLPGGHSPQSSSANTLYNKDYIVDSSTIQHVHKRDDAEIWGGWKRWVFRLVPFLTFANTGLYMAYLALRIACVIWAQNAADTTYAGAWIFIGVEIATAIPSLMHNTWTMWSMKKRNRPKLRLTGNDVPTVDAFITCCGEDDDLVMDTVRAACDLDYPQDRFRVILLDDGKSAGLQEACAKLSMIYPNLYYMARVKIPGQPHHFKAGNLNYGLDEVHKLPGGAGQFMAALDADMIPERDWLRAILPHMLIDPKMALACPPQLFYNTPPSDPLAQSLDFFVHVIEPIKDALGVAWCTGSGYVARREALDEIGNFPLGSLAEDVATSTLMLGKGWKTAFIHEPLQFGTVPEDYGGHLKQRTRWAIGTVDTSFKLNFCLWGDKLVAYATDEQLRWLIRACFASVISNRLCEFALFIPAGYHTGQRGSRYQLWMSPYIALCLIRSFILPTWLGGQTQAFKPTGSLGSALNERDAKLRKNMFRRLWGILINYMALFHLAFVYLTLVAVVLTSFRSIVTTHTVRDTLTALLTHAFWPPLTFLFICSSLWTPVSYAIDPPVMPDREDLLNRDPKTQVAHPTPQSKKIAFGGQAAWFELEYTTTTIYTCLVFVCSFIF